MNVYAKDLQDFRTVQQNWAQWKVSMKTFATDDKDTSSSSSSNGADSMTNNIAPCDTPLRKLNADSFTAAKIRKILF